MSSLGIAERLAGVRAQVDEAARAAGRAPGEVALVAVSKRHPVEAIREAYAAGQRAFGENYVQELVAKAEALRDLDEIRWHFIGHLQRNKAKAVLRAGALVDTVDSARLADAVAKAAAAHGGPPHPICLQVNVGGEAQKSGIAPAELPALIDHVQGLASLRLEGLMTIPPAGNDDTTRRCFEALRALVDTHELARWSMGMSGDLALAVAAGSTEVRVGTAIFGPRPA